MISNNRELKIVDFGHSRTIQSPVEPNGTVSYMAPELHVDGTDRIGKKVDVFAIALILRCLFTNASSPWKSRRGCFLEECKKLEAQNTPEDEAPKEAMKAIILGGIRPRVWKLRMLHSDIRNIVEKAWQENPVNRPSCENMKGTLDD